jgi:hypothetical protein
VAATLGVGEQELERAHLVAARRIGGEVVALDPDVGAERGGALDGRREAAEPEARDALERRERPFG